MDSPSPRGKGAGDGGVPQALNSKVLFRRQLAHTLPPPAGGGGVPIAPFVPNRSELKVANPIPVEMTRQILPTSLD